MELRGKSGGSGEFKRIEMGIVCSIALTPSTLNSRAYYHIVSARTGHVIDIKDNKAVSGAELHTQKYDRDNQQQHWEFVIPVVGFPPGWFQIQNTGSRNLLGHNYSFNPPILLPDNPLRLPSQYRETWNTQWTLVDPKVHNGGTGGENTWCIMNRLTDGFLNVSKLQIMGRDGCTGVYAQGKDTNHTWVLELDPAYNWTIAYHSTACLLEATKERCDGGIKVVCNNNKLTPGDKSKTWFLMYVLTSTPENLSGVVEDIDIVDPQLLKRQMRGVTF